jgi:ATP phosphoribosyltransferase
LKHLYVEELRDLYSAENQLVKAIPKMAHAATSADSQEKRPRVFATRKDALAAFYAGQVDHNQKVEIVNDD